jgi:hypothetical protein
MSVISQRPEGAGQSPFNTQKFIFEQLMAKQATATLVKVQSVASGSGGLNPVGYVHVVNMVNQVDGNGGNPIPHGTMYNLPYFRMQGGTNAVIMDPSPGDIGIAIFAMRDISTVKNTRATANPGSARRYHYSDGLYVGGFLNGTPTQYIEFTSSGITVVSPTLVTIQAPSVTVTSPNIRFN